MGNNTVQIPSSDGCVYVFNLDTGKAQKICDIEAPKDFPSDVKEKIALLQKMVTRREGG
jgi:hypothetical protein